MLNPFFDKHAPKRTVSVGPELVLFSATRAFQRERHAAQKRGDPQYKVLRNKGNSMVKADYIATAVKKLDSVCDANKPRVAWQIAQSYIAPKSKSQELQRQLCQRKQVHHLLRGQDRLPLRALRQPHHCGQQRGRGQQQPRCVQVPLGVATVKTILKRISSSKSCGLHGIPATVWKPLLLSLAVPLMHMVNASFEQCRVPALFKVAKVIPVYKGRQSPGRRPLRTD